MLLGFKYLNLKPKIYIPAVSVFASLSSKNGNVTFKSAENNHKTIQLKDALSLELNRKQFTCPFINDKNNQNGSPINHAVYTFFYH